MNSDCVVAFILIAGVISLAYFFYKSVKLELTETKIDAPKNEQPDNNDGYYLFGWDGNPILKGVTAFKEREMRIEIGRDIRNFLVKCSYSDEIHWPKCCNEVDVKSYKDLLKKIDKIAYKHKSGQEYSYYYPADSYVISFKKFNADLLDKLYLHLEKLCVIDKIVLDSKLIDGWAYVLYDIKTKYGFLRFLENYNTDDKKIICVSREFYTIKDALEWI